VDSTGSYAVAYVVAAGLCLLAAGTTFITKAPDPLRAPVELKAKAHKTKAA